MLQLNTTQLVEFKLRYPEIYDWVETLKGIKYQQCLGVTLVNFDMKTRHGEWHTGGDLHFDPYDWPITGGAVGIVFQSNTYVTDLINRMTVLVRTRGGGEFGTTLFGNEFDTFMAKDHPFDTGTYEWRSDR